YETDQSFTIRVRSTDSTNLTYEEAIIISVVNVNEDPLDINLSPSSVDENSAVGRYVGTFSTVDTDFLTDFTFDYQLVAGAGDTHNSSFAIVNGDLQVNGPIDYEVTPTMSIRVRTTDLGGLSYEEILTININNVNETPTQINLSNASLPENEPAGYEIGTLSNNDPDAGDTLVYSLVTGTGSDDNIMFQIVGDKLQSAVTFDFEARSSYNIRIRVTDRGGFFVERAFVINVTDVNEPPAAITISNNRIRENLPAGTFIGTVSSTDVDNGDSVTIAIVSGPGGEDNSNFQLIGRDLFSTASFDFEAKRLLSVLFEATDSSGLSTRQILQIAVTNVNEAPTSVALTPDSIPESVIVGTTIGNLITTDIDGDNVFRYEFSTGTGSDDNSLFTILGDQLKTNSTFDFDVKKLYSVRVRAIDLGGLSVEQQLFVNITNVNDPPTDVKISNSSVPENSPIGTVVGSFSTTDADDGDSHTYSFVSGAGDADNTLFAIVGNSLVTRNIFNFESRNSYSIRIQTEDAGGLKFEQLFP
ncbi:MAG: cadherin repeat domain-containing protein, partial [Pirellula sp.]